MLSFKIAYRFLIWNKVQILLISLGIAIGVAVQIFIGSLIFGLQEDLINTTVGSSPHIVIESNEQNGLIEEDSKIDLTDKDIKYVSPSINMNGFIKSGNNETPVLARGFNLSKAEKIYKIENNVIKGRLPKNQNEVIIGKTMSKDLKLKVGDNAEILTPAGKKTEVNVVGIFDLGVENINTLWMISDIKTVQNIFGINSKISNIEIQVKDVFSADTVAKRINTDLKVTNWKVSNEQLLSGLNGQSVSSLMIQIFVMISVVLGIASVLVISVVQKRKQIGILKAMGIKDGTSSFIFLFQGLILGILGATLGILLGLGLLKMFTVFAVNPDGTPVVNTLISYKFIALSWGIAILAAVLASIIPSVSSKRLSTIEVIKNG